MKNNILSILIGIVVIIYKALSSIRFFIVSNIEPFSKTLKRKESINYINKLLKNSKSKIEITDFDKYCELKIISHKNIDSRILKLLNLIDNECIFIKFFYNFSNLPIITKFILKKHNDEIQNIADSYLELGEIFFKKEIYVLSIKFLKKALKIYKDNSNLYSLLGSSIYNESCNTILNKYNLVQKILKHINLKESLIYLKKAEKINPNEIFIINKIGNVYKCLGNMRLAEEYYIKGTKNEQNNILLYNNLGTMYKELNKTDKALLYYNKAISIIEKQKIDNGLDLIFGNLTILYAKEGFKNEALDYYYKFLESSSNNFFRYLDIADNIFNINHEEGIKCFQKSNSMLLERIDDYLYEAFAFKNNGYLLLSNIYLETIINTLDKMMSIKYKYVNCICNDYLPIKSFQNRLDTIVNYYKKM